MSLEHDSDPPVDGYTDETAKATVHASRHARRGLEAQARSKLIVGTFSVVGAIVVAIISVALTKQFGSSNPAVVFIQADSHNTDSHNLTFTITTSSCAIDEKASQGGPEQPVAQNGKPKHGNCIGVKTPPDISKEDLDKIQKDLGLATTTPLPPGGSIEFRFAPEDIPGLPDSVRNAPWFPKVKASQPDRVPQHDAGRSVIVPGPTVEPEVRAPAAGPPACDPRTGIGNALDLLIKSAMYSCGNHNYAPAHSRFSVRYDAGPSPKLGLIGGSGYEDMDQCVARKLNASQASLPTSRTACTALASGVWFDPNSKWEH